MQITSFSQLIGNDYLKLALITVAIDPSLNGILVAGPKGTGKSTIIHSLKNILPPIPVIDTECPYHCSPQYPDAICDTCANLLASEDTSHNGEYIPTPSGMNRKSLLKPGYPPGMP